jgi:hypothetical protein
MTSMAKQQPRILEWNGKDVPKTLRSLPQGHYVIEQLAPGRKLTLAEDTGLQQALQSVNAGRTIKASVVHEQLHGIIKQRNRKRSGRRITTR